MIRIISAATDETIGFIEEPRYIRLSASGCFANATAETAQGVAFRSTAYNLQGKTGIGAEDTVYLAQVSAETAWRETEEMYEDALKKFGVETA